MIYPYPYGIVVNRHARRYYDEGKNSFDSTFEELTTRADESVRGHVERLIRTCAVNKQCSQVPVS